MFFKESFLFAIRAVVIQTVDEVVFIFTPEDLRVLDLWDDLLICNYLKLQL